MKNRGAPPPRRTAKPVVISNPAVNDCAVNQQSREDLIELLFLALYLDDHLSFAEDEVLAAALNAIGWESSSPREICLLNAFSKAREANSCALRTEAFLTERGERLKQEGHAALGYTWLSRVLGADGISSSEERFLTKLEKLLFH
jgi:hypothetical protein